MSGLLWTDERIERETSKMVINAGYAYDLIKRMVEEYEARIAHLQTGYMAELNVVEQALGAALGYTRYCDNPEIFPGTTEADGVCVGIHAAGTLAMEAADVIKAMKERLAELEHGE